MERNNVTVTLCIEKKRERQRDGWTDTQGAETSHNYYNLYGHDTIATLYVDMTITCGVKW